MAVDKWLFGTVLLLVLFGLVMVFSASAVMAQGDAGLAVCVCDEAGGMGAAGMMALFVLMRVDYRRYNNYRGGVRR